jgi:hypothetical protein
MPKRRKLLTVAIDTQLAFGRWAAQPLEEFIAGFIEDRLTEEIEFARAEVPHGPK